MPVDFKIEAMVKRLSNVKSTLPLVLQNIGLNYFTRNFKEAKSVSTGIAWPKRKKETKQTKGKALLVASGTLQGSLSNSKRHAGWDYILFGIDGEHVPYAKYINEGTDKMPKREFMGDSPQLRALIHARIRKEMLTVLKK